LDAVASRDEPALRAQLTQARARLNGLVRNLRAIDDELERLAPERKQHRLLQTVCGALEELRELGAAGLFWDGPAADREGDDHVRRVRSRVDVFEKRLGEIEDRRQAVLEEIQEQEETTGLLEDDVFEAERQEEERKLEWIIEREFTGLPGRELVMPWRRGGEDDERLRRSLAVSLLLGLLLGVLIPQIELPLPEPGEPIEVPERLTRLIQQARPLPPPPSAREETRSEPQPQLPEEAPRLAEEAPPEPQAPPGEGPRQGSGEGPGKGPGKGILAFREKLSGIAELQPAARLGSQARISSSGAIASGRPERRLVTSRAPGSSGGINLASLSRDVGGAAGGGDDIEGVQIARATSTIGGGGSGRSIGDGGESGGGPPLGRTDEEIQIVFDRHKAALYRLYNRELRSDPTLKGQMVLRIRIEPDGSVSLCELQASDMRAPQLSAQVVDRVRTFDFGAKEGIAAVTILYPIDFLPAT
jgi:hypothetical protein